MMYYSVKKNYQHSSKSIIVTILLLAFFHMSANAYAQSNEKTNQEAQTLYESLPSTTKRLNETDAVPAPETETNKEEQQEEKMEADTFESLPEGCMIDQEQIDELLKMYKMI